MSATGKATSPAGEATCPRCGIAARTGARFCRSCGADLSVPPASASTTASAPMAAPVALLPPPSFVAPVAPVSSPPRVAPVPPAAPVLQSSPAPDRAPVSAADSAPSAPRIRRSLRRRLFLLAAGLLTLLLGAGLVSVVQSVWYSPDRPVRAFFAAMQAGDGAALGRLSHCESSPLCVPGALATGYDPPEQVQITGVQYGASVSSDQTRRPDRSRAVVSVRYLLAGAQHTGRVSLQRADFGLFRDWSIDTPPGAWLDVVSPYVAQARLAGITVATVKQAGTGNNTAGAIWALPGVYTLQAVADPLFDATAGTVTVAGDDRQNAQPAVTLKPAVLPAIDRQVRDRLDACARSTDMQPTVAGGGCPMTYSTLYSFTRAVRWTVKKYPTLQIRLTSEGLQVHTTAAGAATIHYQWTTDVLEPRTWSAESATTAVTVGGQVVLVDGAPTWSE